MVFKTSDIKLTKRQLVLWPTKGDGLAVGLGARHFDNNSELEQDVVDGVALVSDHILVLGLLDLNNNLVKLLFLKDNMGRFKILLHKMITIRLAKYFVQLSKDWHQGSEERKL